MKQLISLLLLLPSLVWAHGGDDHGGEAKTAASPVSYFAAEAFSEKYEVLVKYGHTDRGKEAALKLFISNYNTNEPIDSLQLKVTVAGHPGINIAVTRLEKGVYQLKGIFPDTTNYNLVVSVNGPPGPDLIQVNDVNPGRELPADDAASVHSRWYQSNLFFGIIGLLTGLLLMYAVMKKRNRKITAVLLFIYCMLPVNILYRASAHEGHNEPGGKGGAGSTTFIVEKETQFLFNIRTKKIGTGDFNASAVLLGTVIPAPQGRAVIQSPQTGKIVSLRVTPGQKVSKGQLVAVVEQQIDAGTQIDIIAQSNSINAEYEAAKAQYERLKGIEDIAAKKEVTEAKARYETAKQNKELFEKNTGKNTGSTKLVSLTTPVSGIVGTFNYAIGAVVNSGETLFEVTNLDQVFVEAQVFAEDVAMLNSAIEFSAASVSGSAAYKLKLISTAQTVNAANQSQRVVFEIINPGGHFKIGENINVRITGNNIVRQVVIPNEAITDVNGKPAVFIKDKAEQYSISFIVKGQSNEQFTVISRGAEDDERVVTENVYQMKMIYLNQ